MRREDVQDGGREVDEPHRGICAANGAVPVLSCCMALMANPHWIIFGTLSAGVDQESFTLLPKPRYAVHTEVASPAGP